MKTILITGASHGIGKAIAEKLAACGMRLFLNCRSSKETLYEYAVKLSETYHVPCTPLFYDVSDHKQVHAMFEEICALGESIDILINNAGISHIGLLQDMSIEEWNQVLNTNLTSAFSCSKYAIPDMITRKQGKIINISSIWGVCALMTFRMNPSDTTQQRSVVPMAIALMFEGGLNLFTQALAKELAPSNIQVNAIACGCIDTQMNACFSEEERAALTDEIPAGRFGMPEEVASLVLTLAEGNEYMTGQIITLDGGWI